MSLRALVCSTAALAALTMLVPAAAQDNYIAPSIVYTDDDGIDTLNADVLMEDVISRDCADK